MICPTCGNMIPDNAKFCGVCGTPMQQTYANGTQQPSVPTDYFMTDPSNAAKCAISDIRSTPGWIKRIFLLAIMSTIPVLNFFSLGYALEWATDSWKNIPRDMPRGTFNKDAFLYGLFYTILIFLFNIGTSWLAICNIIPIAGTILWIVLLIQANVFLNLAAIKMTAFKRFGAAFDMSEIFVKLRLKSSGLYKAYIMPWLICCGIIFGMFLLAFVICTLIGMLLTVGSIGIGPNLLPVILGSFVRVMWLYVIFILIILVASFFLLELAEVWSLRALGYWYGYHAFDWICQANAEKMSKSA